MKRFSDFSKKTILIKEDGEVKPNLPEELKNMDQNELLALLKGVKKDSTESEEKAEVGDSKGTDVSKFFSKLFESREMAHIYHLTVKGEPGSHAAHKALQEYYEGILEFVDEIIEVYQGQYGIVENYDIIDTKETKTKEKIAYFEELVEFIKTERKCIKEEDTHLHNIVDEMVALVYKTLYKLKYNK